MRSLAHTPSVLLSLVVQEIQNVLVILVDLLDQERWWGLEDQVGLWVQDLHALLSTQV